MPAAATALWALIAITHNRFSPIALLLVAEYFFIPAFLLKLSRKEFLKYEDGQKLQFTDALAVFAILAFLMSNRTAERRGILAEKQMNNRT